MLEINDILLNVYFLIIIKKKSLLNLIYILDNNQVPFKKLLFFKKKCVPI